MQVSIQIQELFMNSQSIVNGSTLSLIFEKCVFWDTIQNELKKKIYIQSKKKNIFVYFVLPWRHGRVVRRGTANPFSPVQIRVSPDQQKMQKKYLIRLFCWYNLSNLLPTEAGGGKGFLILPKVLLAFWTQFWTIFDSSSNLIRIKTSLIWIYY